jgi:hypothetical protein
MGARPPRHDLVADGYEDGDLPVRWKRALALADLVLGVRAADDALRRTLHEEFGEDELAELTLTVAMAVGFSKAAIAWGPEPQLPTIEIPTPGSAVSPGD